jgi:hypothetical protein
MPYISADVFHGLKFLVRLFSGELSITSGGCEPDEAELPFADEPEPEELDEQAAIPTTRKPAATMAASRLPLMVLVVNIDYPLGC